MKQNPNHIILSNPEAFLSDFLCQYFNERFVFRHCKITHKSKANIQKNHVKQTPHEAHEETPVIRTKRTKLLGILNQIFTRKFGTIK